MAPSLFQSWNRCKVSTDGLHLPTCWEIAWKIRDHRHQEGQLDRLRSIFALCYLLGSPATCWSPLSFKASKSGVKRLSTETAAQQTCMSQLETSQLASRYECLRDFLRDGHGVVTWRTNSWLRLERYVEWRLYVCSQFQIECYVVQDPRLRCCPCSHL